MDGNTLNIEKMENKLIELSTMECRKMVKKYLNQDDTKKINDVLKSLQCNSRESTERKLEIYKEILDFLLKKDEYKGNLVPILIMNAENLATSAVISLVNYYVTVLENVNAFTGRWTELFGTLILLASKKEDIVIDCVPLDGRQYTRYLLEKICSLRWNQVSTITLLSILKDIGLPKEELPLILNKCQKMLKETDFHSIPPIVYHLMIICVDKCPNKVLELVIDYFNEQELVLGNKEVTKESMSEISVMGNDSNAVSDEMRDSFLEAQGTVLFHITNLAFEMPTLVREYLKSIRNSTWIPQKLITPFNLCLALSMASINQCEETILKSIKSCVLKYYRIVEKSKSSLWLQDTCAQEKYDIATIFKNTAKNIRPGWEQISQELVALCFSFLESSSGLNGDSYASQKCISIGEEVLPILLKREPHLAPSVLRRLSLFIVTSNSAQSYISILGQIVKSLPHLVLENVNILREMLEQMQLLTVDTARQLLQITLPLLKMSMSLKDTLVMILQKMLFLRDVTNRQTAVQGLIVILCHFRLIGALPSSQASMSFSSTLSQFSADVHCHIDTGTNEALCFELLGILRRCFSQQAQVKSVLYKGLFDVMRANPNLSLNIFSMLNQHMKKYLELRPEALNPVLLSKTITSDENVSLVEPFGELLSCLSVCKSWYEGKQEELEDDEEVAILLRAVSKTFDALVDKLAHADMDDLDLGSASFSPATAVGRQNTLKAEVMIGTLDSLIEHQFHDGALDDQEKAKTVISLFKTQRSIIEVVQKVHSKGCKKDSKSKGRPSSKSFQSLLSIKTVSEILSVIFEKEEDSEAVKVFQNNIPFQIHLLSVVEDFLKTLKRQLVNKGRILPCLKTIGRDILNELCHSLPNCPNEEDDIARVKKLLSCFHSLFASYLHYFKEKMGSILKELLSKTSSANVDALYYSLFKKCQEMSRILFSDDFDHLSKDVSVILSVIGLSIREMTSSCDELSAIQDWLAQICKDQQLSSGSLCEQFVSLLFTVSSKMKINNNVVRHFAKDIHTVIGDVDTDIQVDDAINCQIVAEDTASYVLSSVLCHLEESMGLISLALLKGRALLLSGTNIDTNFDKNMSIKFAVVIQAVHELITTAIPQNHFMDNLFRISTKIYNELTIFIRYYLDMYKLESYTQLSDKFEKVIHNTANLLKEDIFKLINYVQGTQNQERKKSTSILTARALKESKLMPSLIFSMEKYESLLAQLSKKSKVNFMSSVKLSTSRDFRFSLPAIARALEQERTSTPEQSSDGDSNDEDESNSPPAKKCKK